MLLEVKLSLKLINSNLDDEYDDISMFNNFDEGLNTYVLTVSAEWNYTQDRPYKGNTIEENRRIYIHYFYSIERSVDEEQAFDKHIMDCCNNKQAA